MRSIGVRQLRQHLSEVLEEVSEEGTEISITSYGKEIARLVPPRKRRAPEEMAALWNRIDHIASEIGQYPSKGMSAVDAVREERE
ncbi:MAG: type II toxin-antitoxin system prevent-host-death family antitoxin [Chloroflexota bacterium]|nr:MAG: type II toxin-antitoxin system prevent-host-death family antitoxin [Chloroflexota bacterium]